MMEKHTIFKNKSETFNAQFNIEGASIKDTSVRLCLEFSDNCNMFFNGNIESNGECTIEIPKLKDVGDKIGKLTIEVIADSVYFKLYEAEVELKNSVEVSMSKPTIGKRNKQETKVEATKVVKKESKKVEEVKEPGKEPQEVKTETPVQEPKSEWHKVVVDKPKYESPKKQPESELEKSSFLDYLKRRN